VILGLPPHYGSRGVDVTGMVTGLWGARTGTDTSTPAERHRPPVPVQAEPEDGTK
jgi:hypothetical protein